MPNSRTSRTLVTGKKQARLPVFRSDGPWYEHAMEQANLQAKRSELLRGLTRRQRTFLLEKLVGRNDKNAALAAGYSLSVAENTKQRIWNPSVRQEFERLKSELGSARGV